MLAGEGIGAFLFGPTFFLPVRSNRCVRRPLCAPRDVRLPPDSRGWRSFKLQRGPCWVTSPGRHLWPSRWRRPTVRPSWPRWRTCCARSRSRSATAPCSDRRGSFCRPGTTSSPRRSQSVRRPPGTTAADPARPAPRPASDRSCSSARRSNECAMPRPNRKSRAQRRATGSRSQMSARGISGPTS